VARLIFYPIDWVIVVAVTETTFYKDKVYLPREVQEKLGLVDGDVLHIEVVEKGVAKLSIARGCRTAKKALEKLDNPPDLGKVKGKLSRKEIYEDIT
jgi:bifunctional DNA-binding transcriptional regulator/antitoxin component of YhaV-PrlF toxin-antitoxin module